MMPFSCRLLLAASCAALLATLALPARAAKPGKAFVSEKVPSAGALRPMVLRSFSRPKLKLAVPLPAPAPPRTPTKFVSKVKAGPIGKQCRQSNKKGGLVARDACGRIYCAPPGWRDIIEVQPRIHEVRKCKWQLKGGTRCLCG